MVATVDDRLGRHRTAIGRYLVGSRQARRTGYRYAEQPLVVAPGQPRDSDSTVHSDNVGVNAAPVVRRGPGGSQQHQVGQGDLMMEETVRHSHHRVDARGRLVRPYIVTCGRTEPVTTIALEAILTTTPRGKREASFAGRDKHRIAHLCAAKALSLAEIASYTQVPLGVARVLVADMATEGLLALHGSDPPQDYGQWIGLLEEVLHGLREL
jgi:hypothetical protein